MNFELRFVDFVLQRDIDAVRRRDFYGISIVYPQGVRKYSTETVNKLQFSQITFTENGEEVPSPITWEELIDVSSKLFLDRFILYHDRNLSLYENAVRDTCAYSIATEIYGAHNAANEWHIRKRAKEAIHKSLQEALPKISKGEEFTLHPYTLTCEDNARDMVRGFYTPLINQVQNPDDPVVLAIALGLEASSEYEYHPTELAPYWKYVINKSPLGCFHITSQQGGALRAVNKDEAQVGDNFTSKPVHYNLGELIEPNYLDIKKGSEFLDLDSVAFNVDNKTNRSITIAHHTGQAQTIEPGNNEDITLFAFPANHESDVYARLTSGWIA